MAKSFNCGRRCFFKFYRFVVWYAHRLAHAHFVLLFCKRQRYDITMAAESSSSKTVSFAEEFTSKPQDCSSEDESKDEDDGDYVESTSEADGEFPSDDENNAEVMHQIIGSLYSVPRSTYARSWVPPVERDSLLLLDKDLIECEYGTVMDRLSNCMVCAAILCYVILDWFLLSINNFLALVITW